MFCTQWRTLENRTAPRLSIGRSCGFPQEPSADEGRPHALDAPPRMRTRLSQGRGQSGEQEPMCANYGGCPIASAAQAQEGGKKFL